MNFFCCDERRRNLVKDHAFLNGIDYIEVKDNLDDPNDQRQRMLIVHFLKDLVPGQLTKENVVIEGGERVRNIKVVRVYPDGIGPPPVTSPPDNDSKLLIVEVSTPGDFSKYTLSLVKTYIEVTGSPPLTSPPENVKGSEHKNPPEDFDPILSAVDFSFKVACPSDFDCKTKHVCPPDPLSLPEINYLAKDYASFRQLILDRLATIMPQWKERNPADLGVTLVELLSYVADHLSYQQDAVATEAYLRTARKRISIRRHARLVDYFIDEGKNARVLIQLNVKDGIAGLQLIKDETKFLTKTKISSHTIKFNSKQYQEALLDRPVIFELMHDTTLYSKHNEMQFYTWGDQECCLPKGATQATLLNKNNNLKIGDILVFMEKHGPETGKLEDADHAKRHAVRLVEINYKEDPVGQAYFGSPPASSLPESSSIPVTEICWHNDDALPFPLCVSAKTDSGYHDNISVALGNIVLADHGLTIEDETIGVVPEPNPALTKVGPAEGGICDKKQADPTPQRFRPKLQGIPLTHTVFYDPAKPPASVKETLELHGKSSFPSIEVFNDPFDVENDKWLPMGDLINSSQDDKVFVAEIESDGTAIIRFGDARHGKRPDSGTKFKAVYRIGNGAYGNVGAETIAHIVSSDPSIVTDLKNPVISKAWNPMSAKGGKGPETIEQVRQNAPYAFRKQERAVTAEDYENISKRCDSDIQRAKATFRWTGSWHTVFLTADRLGGYEVDERFENELRNCLERYRMTGHDVQVDTPNFVSLDVEMIVCVKPGYQASDLKVALMQTLSNRTLLDGRKGVFHPDNFTFGQTVYLSPIYAAVQAVQGVSSAKITKFQRQGTESNEWRDAGKIEMERLEIARLDNDPNYPERGVLKIDIRGGR
ncbi:hypothetical protein SCALIN_C05_0225 [Candidatus Scalindua japonica]|uniref:Uncharacterized protein n=1 Tax=Candidatus Scalindua japonica TaxID=1284222 RepID=A0A286TW79_9BACT|nr:putative baseplate assembly protein [Candidatus Scalindua japonica]GAX60140.1 hypothetical protein SCALIN_C05_0225 [Candidatus Scalindua japonica]